MKIDDMTDEWIAQDRGLTTNAVRSNHFDTRWVDVERYLRLLDALAVAIPALQGVAANRYDDSPCEPECECSYCLSDRALDTEIGEPLPFVFPVPPHIAEIERALGSDTEIGGGES